MADSRRSRETTNPRGGGADPVADFFKQRMKQRTDETNEQHASVQSDFSNHLTPEMHEKEIINMWDNMIKPSVTETGEREVDAGFVDEFDAWEEGVDSDAGSVQRKITSLAGVL
jgi:hypothetical protein